MKKPLNTRWNNIRLSVVFIAIFVGGIAIIGMNNNIGDEVANHVDILIEHQLPQIESFHQLQSNVQELELVLYRYYKTSDANDFQIDWNQYQQKNEALISHLNNNIIAKVRHYMTNLNKIAGNFNAEMKKSERDWDLIRKYLADAQDLDVKFDALMQQSANKIHEQFKQQRDQTQRIISRMVTVQTVFSLFVLGILIIVAILLKRQYLQNQHHHELALFPEQNPHPIFRLNSDGEVIYLNPSAFSLAKSLGLQGSPTQLLPDNYRHDIKEILNITSCFESKDYLLGEQLFSASFHHNEGVDSFYAYLIDVTERAKAEKKLFYQANHDPLTQLPNRRQLEDALNFKTAQLSKPFSLLSIKAGRLYLINASLGYEISDQLLLEASNRLEQFINEQTSLDLELFSFETGGWIVLISNNNQLDAAKQLSVQIVSLFSSSLCIEGSKLNLPCTIGITLFPKGGNSPQDLLKNADAALRQAFREGVSIRPYSEDLSQVASHWLALEQGLKQALDDGEFSLNFQPKVNAITGKPVATEVLLRWLNKGKWISPAEFIPISEESGIITEIGEWVLTQACQQWVRWAEQGLNPHPMAVNVSAQQFIQSGFVQRVAQILLQTGMPVAKLDLEITEEVASKYPEKVIKTMSKLKELGIHIVIDDFGTGYSSLSYLSRFPIDTLKIDQSFVSKMEDSESDAAIVRMIMSLAKELNLKVIAEGVETEKQRQILVDLGCDYIQGFYFYRPLNSQQYQELLTEQVN